MKKAFTIILVVLCFVAFSVVDASSKNRKRISSSSSIKTVYCKLEGSLTGDGEEYRTLVLKGNKGYFVDEYGHKNRVKITKIKGDYMEISVSDSQYDMGSEEHGWMYGTLCGTISGTISGGKAVLDSFSGRYKHWCCNDSEFILMDYTGD
jgi:hypothetical protein